MKKGKSIKENTLFGNLRLLKDIGLVRQSNGLNIRMAEVECFCGNIFTTRITGLKNGRVKSCGCVRKEKHLNRVTKHGMTTSKEYCSWECMKSRCMNPHDKHYSNYGGRGITICEEWMNFENFYADMGLKPDNDYSIDRMDNNGNYNKQNCRWSNKYTQNRNMRSNIYLTYRGETLILSDLAKRVGMHQQTLKARIQRGLPIEEAVIKSYKYTKRDVILL